MKSAQAPASAWSVGRRCSGGDAAEARAGRRRSTRARPRAGRRSGMDAACEKPDAVQQQEGRAEFRCARGAARGELRGGGGARRSGLAWRGTVGRIGGTDFRLTRPHRAHRQRHARRSPACVPWRASLAWTGRCAGCTPRARPPHAVAVGRRAAAHHRHGGRRRRRGVTSRAWPSTASPASASGSRSAAWRTVPEALTPRGGGPRLPRPGGRLRRPPFIALTERAFTAIVNDQADPAAAAPSPPTSAWSASCSPRAASTASPPRSPTSSTAAPPCSTRAGPVLADHGHAPNGNGPAPGELRLPIPGANGNGAAPGLPARGPRRGAAVAELDRLVVHQARRSSASSCCAAASPPTPSAASPATSSPPCSPASSTAPSSSAACARSASRGAARLRRAEGGGRRRARRRRRRRGRRRPGRPRRRNSCALLPPRPTRTRCSRWPRRARPRGRGTAAAGAGRAVALSDTRRGLPRGALGARGRRARRRGARPPAVHLPRPGSFQLLLALQDDDALARSATPSSARSADERYGGELLRSLEVFIESNGQWSVPPAACTATGTPCATGSSASRSSRAAPWTRRATASTSGSPCAAANS